MGLCSSSNVEYQVKYQTNNPAHENTYPEGALCVKPGLTRNAPSGQVISCAGLFV